ncbi:hypothetical protein yc1106_02982 [Curvularia clavata]|uniref:Uncharacterized protein n=1 Tax=Curvularia clavata TaxID=95742 RepID=A0A9Q8Z8C9_CURCL|nr:hypothetical protein yc1106_02982 [Curvularia clavata]
MTSSAQSCDPNYYQEPPFGQETPQDPSARRKLLEFYADLSCIEISDGSEPNVREQCKNVCPPGKNNEDGKTVVSSQSCIFNSAPWLDRTTGALVSCGEEKSHNGVMIRKGYCSCNLPVLEFADTFFVQAVSEAGKILEKVVCPLLKALDLVVAIGMAAIPPPGKAITGGMVAAIKSAKAYKYAYKAQDAANFWADFFLSGADFAGQAGCGASIPKKEDLVKRAFGPLTDVVDEVVPGGINYNKLPCPAKGCKGCKGPKCRGNDNEDNGNNGSPGSKTIPGQTATNNGPESTEQPTKTTGSLAASSVATVTFAPTLSTIIRSSVIATTSPSASPTDSSVIFSSSSQPVSSSSSSSAATPSSLSCQALAALDTEEDPTELKKCVYPIDFLKRHLEKRAVNPAKLAE